HDRKYITIMREEINKTLLLLDDFLSLNKLKLNKDILDINLLLEDVLNNYWLLLKERRIKLIKDTIEDEVYVYGDYNRLTQVFVNIIKNSVEAMSNGGVISICSLIKGKKIVISFKDNGSGMSGEVLKKIKEPFFTTKKNGNGLGVSLSYEIIEGHNGKIEYESKLNEYTLVSIVLPIITV
ncbi:MAG: HAMP domain-containing histidine kinase, partial [Bacilli bacterium]|nr:HAMP domain-containing histidine kinase [Bacilli bacterium]